MPERIAGIQPGSLPWLGHFGPMLRVGAFLVEELARSSAGRAHRSRPKSPVGARGLPLPARSRRRDAPPAAAASTRRSSRAARRAPAPSRPVSQMSVGGSPGAAAAPPADEA